MGDFFKGKKGETIKQEPMLTPEQQAAMGMLTEFAKTGKWGQTGFKAGQAYEGKLGEYDMTEIEKLGQNKLLELVAGTMPEMFQLGKGEIKDLLATDKYDPHSKTGVYGGFKKDVLREAQEASDQLKRQMSITGDTYSTANIQEHGKLAERTHDTLSNKLAELYDTYAQRRLAGAQTAAQMGIQEEGMTTGRIGLSQSLGALGRVLKDAQAKDKYKDWLRGRAEWGEAISAAKSVMGTNVPYGVKELTTPDSPSPFSQLLNTGLQIAGNIAGSYLGGWANTAGSALALG